MRFDEHNIYINCVQSPMKFLEPYILLCEVMQGGERVTWDSKIIRLKGLIRGRSAIRLFK